MLHYILQVVVFQFVFIIFYDVFLRKETFFNVNRGYLILTGLLSVVIPFIKGNQIKNVMPEDFVIRLPEVIIGNVSEATIGSSEVVDLTRTPVEATEVSIWNIILITGIILALLVFVFKICKLVWLGYKNPRHWRSNILIIQLLNSNAAFSFFHFVFLGEKIDPDNRRSILEHEMVHVNQRHSIDLLLFEILRIIFWFNPLVYLYQNRISELHEFIADAKAVKYQNKAEFYNHLLLQVFDTKKVSFINPFFKQSLVKKRILMLSKSRSKQIHILKYMFLIPLLCAMLVYTSTYAQDPKSGSKVDIEMTTQYQTEDQQLKAKYLNELIEMEKSGKSFIELNDFAISGSKDKYISSKADYYKMAAFFDFMLNRSINRKQEQGTFTEEDMSRNQKLESIYNRTYDEYVAWKHTDEAKETWENNTRDGLLRLVVEDASRMTATEKQKMNHKLDMIERDDYFTKLLVVSMDGRSKMIMQNPKSASVVEEVIEVQEVDESVEVPFAIVDQVPIMLSCQEFQTNNELKACMTKNIAKHVSDNFNVLMAKKLGLTGKQRIAVLFKIDKQGNISEVKARAPHPELEKEAIRIIQLLPQFKPGLHKGQPVIVPYSLPILFEVKADDLPSNETDK